MKEGMRRHQLHDPDPALQVKCILCGAATKQVCRTVTTGIPRATHKVRVRDFMSGGARLLDYDRLARIMYMLTTGAKYYEWDTVVGKTTKRGYIEMAKAADKAMSDIAWRA